MTLRNKLDEGKSANILLVGDSLTGSASFMYPYRIAEILAARYPLARVVFQSRQDATTETVQSGQGGQVITVIRDGIPGATTYRADQAATIVNGQFDLVGIFLGVNDAVNFGLAPAYSAANYINNLGFLGRYASQVGGAQVAIITPAWSEHSITERWQIAYAAALSRLVARANAFALVDARQIFEDHYTGAGNAGQGGWFADPSDPTHFGREGHYAIADEFARAVMA